jgi:hypothetical protein
MLLSFASLSNFQLVSKLLVPDWNITKIGHANETLYSVDCCKNILSVTYPAGSYKPSASIPGGLGFYASPHKYFPSDAVTLQYLVKFSDNFEWVKGGKLPGLYLGKQGASGGRFSTEAASVRIMWRRGGEAEAYVYLPEDTVQPPAYSQTTDIIYNKGKGDSLWRGRFKLDKTNWNQISIVIKPNLLIVSINNVQKSTEINWSNLVAAGIIFDTFFGGNDATWATPVTTKSYFKDLQLLK